jgi:Ca2+-binding RTX toxin-like protein
MATNGNNYLVGDAGGIVTDDFIDGLAGDDIIEGRKGNDSLFGSEGNDLLRGGDGNDYLDGGADNDTLNGGTGSDTLVGGSGADFLSGCSSENGAGFGEIDTLFGGGGADTFALGSSTVKCYVGLGNSDYARIQGFSVSQDKIQLQGNAGQYMLVSLPSSLPTGAGIVVKGSGDLIGIVEGIAPSTLNLSASYFVYV